MQFAVDLLVMAGLVCEPFSGHADEGPSLTVADGFTCQSWRSWLSKFANALAMSILEPKVGGDESEEAFKMWPGGAAASVAIAGSWREYKAAGLPAFNAGPQRDHSHEAKGPLVVFPVMYPWRPAAAMRIGPSAVVVSATTLPVGEDVLSRAYSEISSPW